jgi:hypothetical protein
MMTGRTPRQSPAVGSDGDAKGKAISVLIAEVRNSRQRWRARVPMRRIVLSAELHADMARMAKGGAR